MSTVTIGVATLDEAFGTFNRAWNKGEYQGEFISFASMKLLWKTFTPRRMELIQAIAGKGAISLREASRLVGRDVKTTHGDVHALLEAGILNREDDGRIVFPYDAVHVDFMIHAAA
jgi:predicted transcriptional regulator